MCYHAFLSHAQADASGTVAHVYHRYALLGLHAVRARPGRLSALSVPQRFPM